MQDSLFGLDQHEDSRLKNHDQNPKNWMDSFNPLGSESEIINIPGKTSKITSWFLLVVGVYTFCESVC